jgi:hypothetical protein
MRLPANRSASPPAENPSAAGSRGSLPTSGSVADQDGRESGCPSCRKSRAHANPPSARRLRDRGQLGFLLETEVLRRRCKFRYRYRRARRPRSSGDLPVVINAGEVREVIEAQFLLGKAQTSTIRSASNTFSVTSPRNWIAGAAMSSPKRVAGVSAWRESDMIALPTSMNQLKLSQAQTRG